jgi:hypothetical protein
MHMCLWSRSLKSPPITPFQQYVDNDIWLPGLLLSSHCSVRASDTLLSKTDCKPWVTRRSEPLGGGVGEQRSKLFIWILATHTGAVWAMHCVAGLCVSSLNLCLAVHEEAPEPPGGKEQYCFLLWQISTSMHLSTSLKTVSIVLWAKDIVFSFFPWAMLRYFILCLVVLLLDQSDETSLRHPSRYCEEICHFLQNTVTGTVGEHCFAEVCSPMAASE